MRKIAAILIIFTISFFASGFTFTTSNIVKVKAKPTEAIENSENPIMNSYMDLDKLPEEYTPEEAIKNGDVVNLFRRNYNVEKLVEFMAAFKSKRLRLGDMVRVTGYTVEGDAIIKDLIFTEGGVILIRDNTRDKFTNQVNKKRTSYNVVDIRTIKTDERTVFIAITDTGEEIPLATFKEDIIKH